MLKLLVDSQIYIAAGAAFLTAGSLHRLGVAPLSLTSIWVFLATLSFYRLARSPRGIVAFLCAEGSYLLPVTGILALYMGSGQVMLVACLGLLALAYLLPLLSTRGGLRSLGLLKVPLVGVVWAGTCAGLPALEASASPGTAALLLVERFLFITAITLPFEVRDLRVDRRAGLETLAHRFGVRAIRRWSVPFLGLSLLVCAHSVAADPRHLSLLLAHGVACWVTLTATPATRWRFDLGLDGTILLLAAGELLS